MGQLKSSHPSEAWTENPENDDQQSLIANRIKNVIYNKL